MILQLDTWGSPLMISLLLYCITIYLYYMDPLARVIIGVPNIVAATVISIFAWVLYLMFN